jgi:hypothetical protein
MAHNRHSRRNVLKGILKTSAYATPLVLSAGFAREVSAVSSAPPPSTGSITFAPSGAGYVGSGVGIPAGMPFLFLLADSAGELLASKVVMTDSAGRFMVSLMPSGYSVGGATVAAKVNGGNIFVDAAATFAGMPTPTSTSTATSFVPTLAPPTIAATPTGMVPTRPPNCLPGQVCDPTAIAKTAIALTATSVAKTRTP